MRAKNDSLISPARCVCFIFLRCIYVHDNASLSLLRSQKYFLRSHYLRKIVNLLYESSPVNSSLDTRICGRICPLSDIFVPTTYIYLARRSSLCGDSGELSLNEIAATSEPGRSEFGEDKKRAVVYMRVCRVVRRWPRPSPGEDNRLYKVGGAEEEGPPKYPLSGTISSYLVIRGSGFAATKNAATRNAHSKKKTRYSLQRETERAREGMDGTVKWPLSLETSSETGRGSL